MGQRLGSLNHDIKWHSLLGGIKLGRITRRIANQGEGKFQRVRLVLGMSRQKIILGLWMGGYFQRFKSTVTHMPNSIFETELKISRRTYYCLFIITFLCFKKLWEAGMIWALTESTQLQMVRGTIWRAINKALEVFFTGQARNKHAMPHDTQHARRVLKEMMWRVFHARKKLLTNYFGNRFLINSETPP